MGVPKSQETYKFYQICLESMLQGEISWFIIELEEPSFPYQHNLDSFQQKEFDESDKKTVYVKLQVEKIQRGVIDFDNERLSYFLDHIEEFYENRVELGRKVREHGMILIEEGNYKEALQIFKKGFEYLKKVSKNAEKQFTPEQSKVFRDTKTSFLLNISLCHLKAENWLEVSKSCATILKDLNPSNVKALYRSSFALFKLEKYNEALEHAKQGIELEPANKDLRKLYHDIKQMVEIKNDAWKAHMSGIMNRDEFKTAL